MRCELQILAREQPFLMKKFSNVRKTQIQLCTVCTLTQGCWRDNIPKEKSGAWSHKFPLLLVRSLHIHSLHLLNTVVFFSLATLPHTRQSNSTKENSSVYMEFLSHSAAAGCRLKTKHILSHKLFCSPASENNVNISQVLTSFHSAFIYLLLPCKL